MPGDADTVSPTVIDFSAHIHPDDPPENDFFHGFIDRSLGEPVYRDIDALERRYRAAGIDGAVLSQPFYMGHADADRTAAANDSLLEAIDGREACYGLAAIPTAAGPEAAAAEFERCLSQGLHGGSLETESAGLELHHAELEPVLEVADRADAPVLVHPKLHDSLGESTTLSDAWLLNAIFGREAALCASLAKVVHTGVLDRFPDLDLVYHHTGGNIAAMLGRLQNQLEKFPPSEWFEDLPEPVKGFDAFRDQLESRIYLDTAGYDGAFPAFDAAISTLPASQLVFGTDFPFETRTTADFDRMVAPIRSRVSRTDAAGILGGTALGLLTNT